ncbi:GspH/FimT family pseudopilin [uncultured Marinobacter sp.]|uniref:GspH/FimT family pseudopilin n=1 Tax=uncultured Marinobacter sp. TaxID=187379 RepID=UPI0030D7F311
MYLKSRSSGFTLIELMVVLALVAIVAGVAIPQFTTVIENNRVISTTNSSVGLINFARSEAVRRGRAVTVTSALGTMTATLASDGTIIRQIEPAAGNISISNDAITFRSTGLTTAGGDVSFDICAGSGPGRQVTVAPGGRTSSIEVVCP